MFSKTSILKNNFQFVKPYLYQKFLPFRGGGERLGFKPLRPAGTPIYGQPSQGHPSSFLRLSFDSPSTSLHFAPYMLSSIYGGTGVVSKAEDRDAPTQPRG